ncbi:unnamed protein product [Gulo gulo]|uniref:Uncharacterized protein n=1 Tax=Gulo gulo TaxID=48420 RepID=A0A9X9LEB9_GULGU|nr:unnamed protein product [Gulo gulo]
MDECIFTEGQGSLRAQRLQGRGQWKVGGGGRGRNHPGHPCKRAGPPVPHPLSTLQAQTPFAPVCHRQALLVAAVAQGRGDRLVPTGSRGRRCGIARCRGSASQRALWWRWPWAPCIMTPSTGHTPKPSTRTGSRPRRGDDSVPSHTCLSGRARGAASGCGWGCWRSS